MERMIKAQRGDPRVVREPDRLPRAPHVAHVRSLHDGYVHALDALAIGQLSTQLGAGRVRVDEAIDPSVGIVLHKKPGDRVKQGEVLADLHLRERGQGPSARVALRQAYVVARRRSSPPPLVVEIMRAHKPTRR
jgi:thymidine phosphorylase